MKKAEMDVQAFLDHVNRERRAAARRRLAKGRWHYVVFTGMVRWGVVIWAALLAATSWLVPDWRPFSWAAPPLIGRGLAMFPIAAAVGYALATWSWNTFERVWLRELQGEANEPG